MNTTKERVKPELLGGFRDFLPQEMAARQWMLDTIQQVYERFGYVPLATPALERSSVLGTDDPDFDMQIYRFKARGEQDVSLRFDLTVPLARVVAAYPDLPKPFKRYQVGPVWRAEKPQAGRYCEFYQFDADVVGTASMLADAEIIILIWSVMKALGVEDILIHINNRKVLNALPELAGFPSEKINLVLRALDSLDKTGEKAVRERLARQPDNQYDESAPALDQNAIDWVMNFINLRETDKDKLLQILSERMASSAIGMEGVKELFEIKQYVDAYGVPTDRWTIDLSVARGLDYYTGPVFETVFLSKPEFGSIMSGGRFDDMVMRFTGQKVPAVGASVGVDRLFTALQELGRLPTIATSTKVLIANFNDTLAGKRLELAAFLRSNSINTELYFNTSKLQEQIAYALKRGIPYLVILGEREAATNVVAVKDLTKRTQTMVTPDQLLQSIS